MIELTPQNFDSTIQAHDLVIVDFWAKWCGPCLAFAPILEELSHQHPDVLFAKVDIDIAPNLVNDFNIRSVPFLMIFRREFAVFAEAGVKPSATLNQLILDAKKIDIDVLRSQIPPENT